MREFDIQNEDGSVVKFKQQSSGYVGIEAEYGERTYIVVNKDNVVTQWFSWIEDPDRPFLEAIRNAGFKLSFVEKYIILRNGEEHDGFTDEDFALEALEEYKESEPNVKFEIKEIWNC